MTFFRPRPAPAAASHGFYTRRVARLRVALPLAALFVLALVFLWPMLGGQQIIKLPSLPDLPQLTMEKPHFSGTDDQNRPYSLSAARATQQPGDLMVIDLDRLEARMTLQDNVPMAGTARLGRFDQRNRRLWLGGDVAMRNGEGYNFATSEMFVDMTSRTVWGDKPARLTGSFGTVEGQGFRAYDNGKTVLFTGQSRAILNMEGAAPSGAAPRP